MDKIIKKDLNDLHCYVGETLNNEPHGKGEMEIYSEGSEIHKKALKQIDPKWEKKYQKNFLHKTKGYLLSYKHVGNWKKGKLDGLCEIIDYFEPSFFTNKDETPTISQIEIGFFKNGKKEGFFKMFLNNPTEDVDVDYTIGYYEYKNDFTVKNNDGKIKEAKEKDVPDEIKKISR
tara:strand:- start:1535 stop:2059 length:525 start_codon:yes stop_codon:yes gene_type:complete